MVRGTVTAVYPTSLATTNTLGVYTNILSVNLTEDVLEAQTNFPINDVDGVEVGMFGGITSQNGFEIVQVTAIDTLTNTLTVTRQLDGTGTFAHPDGTILKFTVPAISFNQQNAEIIALQTYVGTTTGSSAFIKKTGDTQTLTGDLTIKPTGTNTALTLDLQNGGATGTRFLSFKVAGVEKGYANYDSSTGEIDFVNTNLSIGSGSKLILEDNQILQFGDSSKGTILYNSSLGIIQGTGVDWDIQKFGGRVNVKAYGAKGDGVTDDTVAIKAARDALTSGFTAPAGGELFFPPGTFMFSSEVLMTGWGYVVVGSGAYTTVLKAMSGFTGTSLLRWTGDGGTFPLNRAVGIRDLQVDMNDQPAHALVMEKPYDHIVVRNIRVLNINDSYSAWRIIKVASDTSSAKVGQTVLVENSIFTHKNDLTPTAPTVYWQRVQEAVLNGSKAWGGVSTATTTPAVPWHFDDCRGIVMVGCSSVGSSTAGVYITATERSVVGVDIIGHTFEGLGPALVTGVTGSFRISQLNLKEPRIEGTVGGVSLSGVQYGTIETRSQAVTIDSLCTSPRIYTNDYSLVTDNGSRTSIEQYVTSSTNLNTFYPNLSVASSNTPFQQFEIPGRTNFWRWAWSATPSTDFSFQLRHYADGVNPTTYLAVTTTETKFELNNVVLTPEGTTITDGALVNSPDLVLRAQYDSDPTTGVTTASKNASFRHVMTTGGASPASEVRLLFTSTTQFTFSDTGLFTINNQGAGSDPSLSSNSASKIFLVENGFEIKNASTGANPILTSSSASQSFTMGGNIFPSADATWTVGNSTNRFSTMFATEYRTYGASGDAQPTMRLGSAAVGIHYGAGGASAPDVRVLRQAASVLELTDPSGTLAGSVRLGIIGGSGDPHVSIRGVSSDTNSKARMTSTSFELGAGGASSLDWKLTRTSSATVTLTGNITLATDDTYSLGDPTHRLANVYAAVVTAGDLAFTDRCCEDCHSELGVGDEVTWKIIRTEKDHGKFIRHRSVPVHALGFGCRVV